MPECVRHTGVPLSAKYEIGKELGRGSFASVKRVEDKDSHKVYAAKIIDTSDLQPKGKEMIDIEAEVLTRVDHPNIIQCHEIFEEPAEITFVLEIISGGELFDKVVKVTFFSEVNASKAVRQLTEAIKHMHDNMIIHRDIKAENLLCVDESDDADIKLADFGLSHLMTKENEKLRQAVGTPGYIAPEVLLTLEDEDIVYGKECDLFSIGVILYILLCGFPPFYAEDDDECFDLTIAGDYEFTAPYWDSISEDAKDLVKRLLVVDPEKRATCDEVLAHPWISGKACNKEPLTSMQQEMKKWRARRRWKKAGAAIVATRKFAKLIQTGDHYRKK